MSNTFIKSLITEGKALSSSNKYNNQEIKFLLNFCVKFCIFMNVEFFLFFINQKHIYNFANSFEILPQTVYDSCQCWTSLYLQTNKIYLLYVYRAHIPAAFTYKVFEIYFSILFIYLGRLQSRRSLYWYGKCAPPSLWNLIFIFFLLLLLAY